MLGIVDSGVGGLGVLKHIRARCPELAIVYLADHANAPLGVRPTRELISLFQRYVARLEALHIDVIAMGSNTLCAAAHAHGWPASRASIIDIIATSVRAIVAHDVQYVGVLATAATANSRIYSAMIRKILPQVRVEEVGASDLVELVENGDICGAQAAGLVDAACARFAERPELMLLGCTHFSFLRSEIERAVGPDVLLLDPAEAQARAALVSYRSQLVHGGTTYLTTGNVAIFRARIEQLSGSLGANDTVECTPAF
jgi:glutamate racemase